MLSAQRVSKGILLSEQLWPLLTAPMSCDATSQYTGMKCVGEGRTKGKEMNKNEKLLVQGKTDKKTDGGRTDG